MMGLVNFDIMKNPLNWVIVFLMLAIAGIGGHLAGKYLGIAPA
ncbi:MAG: hypothetical protein ACP5EP_12260 [Acidobacteriaceae bacterium]